MYIGLDLVNDNLERGSLIRLYPGYCQELLDIKCIFNPNENTSRLNSVSFLFSSNDNILKYYSETTNSNNTSNSSIIKFYEGHQDFIMHIDIKKNFISTASKDGTIRVWEYSFDQNNEFNCKCLAVLKGHSEAVNSTCLIVKKGFKLASGSKDMSVKIWDFSSSMQNNSTEQNKKITLIKESLHSQSLAHNEEVNLVKVSPNEKLLASASYDKTIKIWNNELQTQGTLSGHKRAVTDISFSKYAKILASSSTDKTIKIWNLNDYSCINTLQGHLSSVLKLHWIYFGTHIISCKITFLIIYK
jgi:U3 small nucleolar RNA-associated protein 13